MSDEREEFVDDFVGAALTHAKRAFSETSVKRDNGGQFSSKAATPSERKLEDLDGLSPEEIDARLNADPELKEAWLNRIVSRRDRRIAEEDRTKKIIRNLIDANTEKKSPKKGPGGKVPSGPLKGEYEFERQRRGNGKLSDLVPNPKRARIEKAYKKRVANSTYNRKNDIFQSEPIANVDDFLQHWDSARGDQSFVEGFVEASLSHAKRQFDESSVKRDKGGMFSKIVGKLEEITDTSDDPFRTPLDDKLDEVGADAEKFVNDVKKDLDGTNRRKMEKEISDSKKRLVIEKANIAREYSRRGITVKN